MTKRFSALKCNSDQNELFCALGQKNIKQKIHYNKPSVNKNFCVVQHSIYQAYSQKSISSRYIPLMNYSHFSYLSWPVFHTLAATFGDLWLQTCVKCKRNGTWQVVPTRNNEGMIRQKMTPFP